MEWFKSVWLDPGTRKPLAMGDAQPAADVLLEAQSLGGLEDGEVEAMLNINLVPLTDGVFLAP